MPEEAEDPTTTTSKSSPNLRTKKSWPSSSLVMNGKAPGFNCARERFGHARLVDEDVEARAAKLAVLQQLNQRRFIGHR